jgi:hypothetical protein
MAIIDPLFQQREAQIKAEEEEARQLKWHTWRFTLYPRLWTDYTNPLSLSWTKIKFQKSNRKRIPEESKGVYSFLVDPRLAAHPGTRFLVYIGKVEDQSFRERYDQYLRDKTNPKARPAVLNMLRMWEDHLWFCYAPITDVALIGDLEDDLITAFVPPVNKTLAVEIRRIKKRADL